MKENDGYIYSKYTKNSHSLIKENTYCFISTNVNAVLDVKVHRLDLILLFYLFN